MLFQVGSTTSWEHFDSRNVLSQNKQRLREQSAVVCKQPFFRFVQKVTNSYTPLLSP